MLVETAASDVEEEVLHFLETVNKKIGRVECRLIYYFWMYNKGLLLISQTFVLRMATSAA